MDLDLVFASDCDIKFSLKKISAKIGDFSLRGLLRVVFKPLITDVPLIGGVQVYFLTPPEIDFDLGGVANALDAPGTQIKSSQFLKIMHKCGFARGHLGFGVFCFASPDPTTNSKNYKSRKCSQIFKGLVCLFDIVFLFLSKKSDLLNRILKIWYL